MTYKELYFTLFHKISDVIEELQTIQCQMEELYVESDIDCELDEVAKNETR